MSSKKSIKPVESKTCTPNTVESDLRRLNLIVAIKCQAAKLRELKQVASKLPVIPSIRFVVTKGEMVEEFESHWELSDWAYTKCKDVRTQVEDEYRSAAFNISRRNRGEYTVIDYTSDNLKRLLGENDYKLERVKV